MRKLAAFAAAFSAGVFTAQYLLPREWQLPGCAALLLLSLTGFLLQGHGRLRVFLLCGGAAAALWRDRTRRRAFVTRVMRTDFSFDRSAGEYMSVYEKLKGKV